MKKENNKTKITEKELNEVIQNSIYNVLNEAFNIGDWLGHKKGSLDKWWDNQKKQYKQAYKAGWNNQAYKAKDYDPYARYKDGDNFVGYDDRALAQDRDNFWNEKYNKYYSKNPSNYQGPSAYPDLNNQNQTKVQNQSQSQNNTQNNDLFKLEQIEYLSELLQKCDFKLINGRWLYKGQPQDKAEESQDEKIRNWANRYYQLVNNNLQENLDRIIFESIKEAYQEQQDSSKIVGCRRSRLKKIDDNTFEQSIE